jgi:hypothetical protein
MRRTFVASAVLLVSASAVQSCSGNEFQGKTEAGGASGEGGAEVGGTGPKGGTSSGGTSGGAGEEAGSGGSDGTSVCPPNERSCEGNLARLCNETGTGFLPGTDCTAIGARCLNGRCENGLTAYWPFDEASGTSVTDATGNGYDGVAIDAQWVAGRVRGAIEIAGSGSYVELGDQMNDLAAPFSIASWVWIESNEGTSPMLLASDANTANWVGFWIQRNPDGRLHLSYGSGNGAGPRTRRTLESDAPLPEQEWVHIAAVVGPELRLFVNGMEIPGTLSGEGGPMVHTSDPFYIGTRDGAATGWNGRIDELRIYQRALSAEEIAALAAL